VISCAETGRQLWHYVNHTLSPDDQERVKPHLSSCRSCRGELEVAKELWTSPSSDEAQEIPDDVRLRLERFIEEL
jgi:hypothetical protein